MPIEFIQTQQPTGVSGDTLCKMAMAYDGTGRRISKTRWVKAQGDADWSRGHVTHYTGIGTEVRENFAGPAKETKVVVNMPQGLGRYGIEDADHVAENGSTQTFEWYLKNHLGSTMLVYGTRASSSTGGVKAAYDYRSFGEQIELTPPSTGKVTENFTGKERDDETQLDYFGARYLDPMLGLWISVDNARQFDSPYTYAGNNPIIVVDLDGNVGFVGGMLGVAEGVALTYLESLVLGTEFNYTLADGVIDFASGCVGMGMVEKGKKAYKLFGEAKNIRKTKPITYKKSGAVATKHKWANKAENFEKEAMQNIKDIIPSPKEFLDDKLKHAVGNAAEDAIKGDPGPADVLNMGEGSGSMAPSDNTSIQLEFDR